MGLAIHAALAGATGRFGGDSLLSLYRYTANQFAQSDQRLLPVLLLSAVTLRLDYDHAITAYALIPQPQ